MGIIGTFCVLSTGSSILSVSGAATVLPKRTALTLWQCENPLRSVHWEGRQILEGKWKDRPIAVYLLASSPSTTVGLE